MAHAGQMNYSMYWDILKRDNKLRLQFQLTSGTTPSGIMLMISRYRNGIAQCKSRDVEYLRTFPNSKLVWEQEEHEANELVGTPVAFVLSGILHDSGMPIVGKGAPHILVSMEDIKESDDE